MQTQNPDKFNLTLSSHPGKAIVMKEKTDQYGGHEVNWFTVGDASKCVEVTIKQEKAGHCYIKYTRKNGEEGHAFDCAMGEYHEFNKIPGYHNHQGGNQWFIVNYDQTISPTHAPEMVWGIKADDLVLLKNTDNQNKLVFDSLPPTYTLENLKVMPLCPSSHPGKAIVLTEETRQHGHGMEQMVAFGDSEKAVKIFVDDQDHIHNAEKPQQTFDGYEHEERPIEFFTKHLEYAHQKYVINVDGTIGLKMDQEYVLGTDDSQKKVMHVKKDSPNKFVFAKARDQLGVEEQYKERDALEAKLKIERDAWYYKLNNGYKLKNGVQMRYSQEIGGDKNTNNEILEWPSDEFLGNLTQDQMEDFKIDQIKWVKGTHFGEEHDYCNSMRFVSNNSDNQLSTDFGDKETNDEISTSSTRIAKICAKTNYHHVFCYKIFDDLENLVGKPIYSKYEEKGEEETTVEIGLDEKLVGFRIQLSDWVDCKISKISFKIAKCSQKGFDYESVREQVQVLKAEKLKQEQATLEFLKKSNLAKKDQIWYIVKHNGEKFIQHNLKNGKYEAYRLGTDEMVDSGEWHIDGTTYHEKTDGKWKGQIRYINDTDYYIDFNAGEHGYHKYISTSDEYKLGFTMKEHKEWKNNMAKPDKGDAWYEINYADFCGGDAKNESCDSYEQAVKMVLLKPKKSNVAYQWWSDHKRLYTKPTNRGATWTNEHTSKHPTAGHLFVWGQSVDFEADGKTLIKMDNVDSGGGPSDGHIDHKVNREDAALKKVKDYKNSKVAYFWCSQSNRLIEKPPSKRQGKWNTQKGVYFMYANKIHHVEDAETQDQTQTSRKSSGFSLVDLVDEESLKYNRIEMKQFDQVFGILCAQEWKDQDDKTYNYFDNGKGTGSMGAFTWILNPDGKVIVNLKDESFTGVVAWKRGKMTLEVETGDISKQMTASDRKSQTNTARVAISLQDVAKDPGSFKLIMSGHNDHPDCNGVYEMNGKENGKPKYAKQSGGPKVFWTGSSWDCCWGGYSPEAPEDTPVPPFDGYTKDQGGCNIKIVYERIAQN